MTRHTAGNTDNSVDPADDSNVPDSPRAIPKQGWFATVKRAFKQFTHDDVTDRAAALTYFGVLALFPGILVLVSILGLLGKSQTQKFLTNLDQLAPSSIGGFLRTVIEQVQGKAGTAGIAAIIGLALALWSASGYVAAFMRAANSIYEVDEGRPIWRTAPLRLGVTLALVIMLVISAVIVVATGPIADKIGSALGIGHTGVVVWDIVKWPVLLIIVSLMFSLLYKATPNVKQPGFKWITLGGVVAVLTWVIASGLFAVYVSFSGSYNKTYGSLATVIVFLVWLWISNIAILLGLEIDAETQRQRMLQAGLPEDVEPFAPVRSTKKLDDTEKDRVAEADRIRERTVGRQD